MSVPGSRLRLARVQAPAGIPFLAPGSPLSRGRAEQVEGAVLTRRQFTTAGLALLAATPARAQTWPTGTIRILAGYPAGGGIDLVARLFAEQMKAAFRETVIVENRPGASAMIASDRK